MRVEQARPRRRVRRGVSLTVIAAVVLLTCLCVGTVAMAASVLFGGNRSVAASFIEVQPGARNWNGTSRVTALLIGVGGHAGSSSPARELIALSFDPATRSVHMLSIPANLWVTIPGFGQDVIGDAYPDGGVRLTLLTVQSVLHVDFPYYVVANTATLHDLVNAVGGVTVGIDSPLTLHVHESGRTRIEHLDPGMRHLNGARAVAVLNMPNNGTGDVMRRQQDLLLSLERALLSPANVLRIPTLVNSFGGQFSTNFPYNATPTLAQRLAHVRAGTIGLNALTYFNGAITGSYMTGRREVLMGNWPAIRSIAQRTFPDAALPAAPVRVLNGAGLTGEAASLATWLRLSTVHVTAVGSAASFNYARTHIIIAEHASPAALRTAAALSTLLQIPTVRGRIKEHGPPITVIIGRDFQDLTQQ